MKMKKKIVIFSDGSTIVSLKAGFDRIVSKRKFTKTDFFSLSNSKKSSEKKVSQSHKKYKKKYT